jgi:hypothetical protein
MSRYAATRSVRGPAEGVDCRRDDRLRSAHLGDAAGVGERLAARGGDLLDDPA